MTSAILSQRSLSDSAYSRIVGLATRTIVEPVLGARYLSLARWMDQWDTWDTARQDEWRDQSLQSILRYASLHVPAYRHLQRDGSRSLRELPVIDKQMIIDAESFYLSDEHESIAHVEKHTGGSTGDPWNYPLDRDAWAHSYAIQIQRFEHLGTHYGDRRVQLGFPTSLGLQKLNLQKRVRLRVERTDVSLCGFEVDPATSLHRAKAACSLDASMWYGYASTIAAMAAVTLDHGLNLTGPPLVVTMAEPLWPSWKEDIEQAFGSRVVEEYGCNDGGIMSHRCESGNFHLADHQSIVEVVGDDDIPVPNGVDGDIVITSFHARHLPFLRYRVGDIGSLGPEVCPCGVPGRTISHVSGRTGDLVRLPDGTELTPATFYNPFNEVEGVRRWQIIQNDPSSLEVRIEPRPNYSEADETLIRNWMETFTRHQLDVTIDSASDLLLTSGGKHKIIIRSFD